MRGERRTPRLDLMTTTPPAIAASRSHRAQHGAGDERGLGEAFDHLQHGVDFLGSFRGCWW